MTAADELAQQMAFETPQFKDLPEVRCADCGRAMQLARRNDGKRLWYWQCEGFPRCKGRHSAHQKTGQPMGTPTNEAGMRARQRAHAAFDVLWKSGVMRRKEAYAWLTLAMGRKQHVHIGELSEEECAEVVRLCLKRKFGGDK